MNQAPDTAKTPPDLRDSLEELVLKLGAGLAEAAWPLLAVGGLPLLLGVPWAAILDGTPDMAAWLLTSAGLGLITAGGKVWGIRQAWRSGGRPQSAGRQTR